MGQALKEAKMLRSQQKKGTVAPPADAATSKTNLKMPADSQKNQAYYESLMEAMNTILKTPTFSNIQAAEPLPIKDGADPSGVQAGSVKGKTQSCE